MDQIFDTAGDIQDTTKAANAEVLTSAINTFWDYNILFDMRLAKVTK